MYYTQRRGGGIPLIHGTKIGIAASEDNGATWSYVGSRRADDARDDQIALVVGRREPASTYMRQPEICVHLLILPRNIADRYHESLPLHRGGANRLLLVHSAKRTSEARVVTVSLAQSGALQEQQLESDPQHTLERSVLSVKIAERVAGGRRKPAE
jgi:hypothetical protein